MEKAPRGDGLSRTGSRGTRRGEEARKMGDSHKGTKVRREGRRIGVGCGACARGAYLLLRLAGAAALAPTPSARGFVTWSSALEAFDEVWCGPPPVRTRTPGGRCAACNCRT